MGNKILTICADLYYSNCDLKDSTAYLYLYNKIDEYNLLYDDKYSFLLGINDDNKLEFVDHYFVNLLEFEFFESHSKDTIKVNSLYFPYSSEYIEYDLSIVIESFISVKVEFSVFTKGDLLGECETSKYCLRYESD